MHFGKTLKGSIFPPWKDKYIDYAKLQKLLREDESDEDGTPWTEEDERNFCDEIFNVQLEKVALFQQERFDALKQRVDDALKRLGEVAPDDKDGKSAATGEDASARLKELKSELDEIIKEVRELKRYSNINYTGFLKIVKKHDRKRRNLYPIRPMTQLRLAERPFNSESSYRPLLDKLHLMYSAIREQVDTAEEAPVDLDNPAETHNGERYTAYKCMFACRLCLFCAARPQICRQALLTEPLTSLDPSRQPTRSGNVHSSSTTRPGLQSAVCQGIGRQRSALHHLVVLRQQRF